jgi:hypothetical protein
MNERIKDLILESGFPVFGKMYVVSDGEELNKFAQLIAKECADICLEMAAKCGGIPGDGALAKDCAYWIKKDFGVEE